MQMQAYRKELAERIGRAVPADGRVEALKGLHFQRSSTPTQLLNGVSQPSFCVIAQGSKEVMLGDRVYRYDPAHYLLATAELPVVGQVIEATAEQPYLSLRLELDSALVGAIHRRQPGLRIGRGMSLPGQTSSARKSGALFTACLHGKRRTASPAV